MRFEHFFALVRHLSLSSMIMYRSDAASVSSCSAWTSNLTAAASRCGRLDIECVLNLVAPFICLPTLFAIACTAKHKAWVQDALQRRCRASLESLLRAAFGDDVAAGLLALCSEHAVLTGGCVWSACLEHHGWPLRSTGDDMLGVGGGGDVDMLTSHDHVKDLHKKLANLGATLVLDTAEKERGLATSVRACINRPSDETWEPLITNTKRFAFPGTAVHLNLIISASKIDETLHAFDLEALASVFDGRRCIIKAPARTLKGLSYITFHKAALVCEALSRWRERGAWVRPTPRFQPKWSPWRRLYGDLWRAAVLANDAPQISGVFANVEKQMSLRERFHRLRAALTDDDPDGQQLTQWIACHAYRWRTYQKRGMRLVTLGTRSAIFLHGSYDIPDKFVDALKHEVQENARVMAHHHRVDVSETQDMWIIDGWRLAPHG